MDDWFNAKGSAGRVDVVALLDSGAGVLLHEIVGLGAFVSMGLTRDGGALGITVTADGQKRRDYFRDAESAAEWLGGAAEFLGGGRSGSPPLTGSTRTPKGPRAA